MILSKLPLLLALLLVGVLSACDSAGGLDDAATDPVLLGAAAGLGQPDDPVESTAEIVQPNAVLFSRATLYTGQTLKVGQKLQVGLNRTSCFNACKGELIMQGDGNLVLYITSAEGPFPTDGVRRPVWSTKTAGKRIGGLLGSEAVVQNDGNFVLYTRAGRPVWNSGTWGRPKNNYVLQLILLEGDLVILRIQAPGGTVKTLFHRHI